MPTVTTNFVTIACDATECENTVTFPGTPEGEKQAFTDKPWMHTLRVVQAVDERKFVYCSDECELKGVASGIHNKVTIIAAQNAGSVQMAAEAAERARQATAALKSGNKVVLG